MIPLASNVTAPATTGEATTTKNLNKYLNQITAFNNLPDVPDRDRQPLLTLLPFT